MDDTIQTWIVHLDMDAFYASVEQLDNPEYKGKPLIIGGGDRGVVSTCSYEARKFGVHSAMPSAVAKQLCPRGIFIPGRMERYAEVSAQIMQLLPKYSPTVEKASIDEAYLDFTGLDLIEKDIEAHACALQQEIFATTGLTCSLGLAPIKFLAKIASDIRKPGGFTVIYPHEVLSFLASMPVRKIPGVGKQTLALLETLGVVTGKDVRNFSKEFWVKRLGKGGEALLNKVNGIDPRKVEPYTDPKSESAENTFSRDTTSIDELSQWLFAQSERVGFNLRKHQRKGRTITLKVKFDDFTQITRSKTLKTNTNTTKTIYHTAIALLHEVHLTKPVRLIGVGVSQFGIAEQQLNLLNTEQDETDEKEVLLDETLDQLRMLFGKKALVRGKLFQFTNKTTREE